MFPKAMEKTELLLRMVSISLEYVNRILDQMFRFFGRERLRSLKGDSMGGNVIMCPYCGVLGGRSLPTA